MVAVQRQSWPDHKKDARRMAAMANLQGGPDVKVLNNLEIVIQNLSLPNTHHHKQKESARLGITYRDGSVVIPPQLLSARSEPSPSSRKRYIIYLCTGNLTCCGWGDRQHGILSAYLISLVTNRTFGVDMTKPCPIGILFHPRIVDWPRYFLSLRCTNQLADRPSTNTIMNSTIEAAAAKPCLKGAETPPV